MTKNKLYQKFYPTESVFNSLSMREQKQLPMVIGSNLIFMVMFALFGITLIIEKNYLVGIGGIFLLAFFLASILLIKNGKIHTGAWLTTFAIAIVSSVVCFGAPFQPTNFLPYRDSCFIVVMTVCNYVISLRRKQLHGFFIYSIVNWILANSIMYKVLYEINFADALINIIICTLAIITTNVCILLFDNFTRKVVELAAENENKSLKAFEKLSAVINETKEGLNIGKELSASTEKASDSVNEIKDLYSFINSETNTLSSEANNIKDYGIQINDKADKMRTSAQNQNELISNTSKSLNQMSDNIANISKIANQQRSGMSVLLQNLDSQMQLMEHLVDDVMRVKESSKKVSNFVEAVNKISSQTGLLAMNASIEAAHAGTLGKGFAVIAQEIRKLSEETSRNAQKITENLQENEEIVNTTSKSVTSFSTYTKNTTEELRKTIQIIEEILSGIAEIDTSTREVMNSISQIVLDADTNTKLAEGVAQEIIQQNSALQNISGGTQQLQTRISNLEALLENIRNAINQIDKNASANEIVAAKISEALE